MDGWPKNSWRRRRGLRVWRVIAGCRSVESSAPAPICRWRSESSAPASQAQERARSTRTRTQRAIHMLCFLYHCSVPPITTEPAGSVTRGTATARTEQKEAVAVRSCTSQLTTTGSDERVRDLESDLKGSNAMTRVVSPASRQSPSPVTSQSRIEPVQNSTQSRGSIFQALSTRSEFFRMR